MALKHRLLVDHIVCNGHGLYAELLPERIRWKIGYPIIDGAPFGSELMGAALRSADACPRLALGLETDSKR